MLGRLGGGSLGGGGLGGFAHGGFGRGLGGLDLLGLGGLGLGGLDGLGDLGLGLIAGKGLLAPAEEEHLVPLPDLARLGVGLGFAHFHEIRLPLDELASPLVDTGREDVGCGHGGGTGGRAQPLEFCHNLPRFHSTLLRADEVENVMHTSSGFGLSERILVAAHFLCLLWALGPVALHYHGHLLTFNTQRLAHLV